MLSAGYHSRFLGRWIIAEPMFQTFRYRNVEPHCRSLHCQRLRKLPNRQNEQRSPTPCIWWHHQAYADNQAVHAQSDGIYTIHPRGVTLLCFWRFLKFSGFPTVKTKAQKRLIPKCSFPPSPLRRGGTFTCLLSSPVGKQFALQIYNWFEESVAFNIP